jgi:hypothetical protein
MTDKPKRTKEEFIKSFTADDSDRALQAVESEQIVEPKKKNHDEQEGSEKGAEKG